MTVNRIAVDGLWRCLCPSFDSITLSQSTRPLPRPPKPFPRSKARAVFPKCLRAREFSTSVRVRSEEEGPNIRFHVAKVDAPVGAHARKAWAKQTPNVGGLEGGHTPGDPLGEEIVVDTAYWKLKKERSERAGRGLTEYEMRKSLAYDGIELEDVQEIPRQAPRDSTAMSKASKSSNQTRKSRKGKGLWGLEQPEEEDAELAKKLQGTLQRRTGQDSTVYLHDFPEQNENSSIVSKQQKKVQRSPIRPLWVPHREYGGTIATDFVPEDPSSGSSPKFMDERTAFFQVVREQRQQHAAQLPRLRRPKADKSNVYMQPAQPGQQVSETKPVVWWEQEKWDQDETDTLHDRLRSYRTQEGNYGRVVGLVEYLVKNRGEKPALIHYESLIRANADAENGSAECVRTLLEEMKEEGIRGDSGLYHGALQALAIHPDYALRADIMQEMKERWFGLSPEGWHSLVVGLLRDRQIEMAVDKLEQMHSDDILIQPWLYDIFTYLLCELRELDEAYKLVRHRYENSRLGITQDHWHYLLDQFSNAYHYEATKEIWDSHVRNSELVPSDGTCVSVLNLAARNADPALATSVIQILSARQTPLSPFHYEALVAAYTGIEDIKTAFRVLAIMEKAGHDPSASSTRPLHLYLSGSDQLCHEAWKIVKRLHKDGHTIPVTAVNVIIESLTKTGQHDAAFEYYKRLHEICPCGPNTETINVTLQGLGRTKTSGKARAMFLASEIQALDIKPDILTYDRLILICLKEDDYEDAFRYLEEMEEVGRESVENNQMGWWMRQGTAGNLVRVCAVSGDDRAWKILEEMKERGMAVNKLKNWVDANWNKAASGKLEAAAKA